MDLCKSAEMLSDKDLKNMKYIASLYIRGIFILLDSTKKPKYLKELLKDEVFSNYYNGGQPYLEILVEYYYTLCYYWNTRGGSAVDVIEDVINQYRNHISIINPHDNWNKYMAEKHFEELKKSDHNWYKRFNRPSQK
jgi:hypothetical protein